MSNSIYSLIGALRCLAQGVSYEVRLAIIFITLALPSGSIDLYTISCTAPLMFVIPVVGLLWFIRCLAETNRRPFDFAEGESELVSGYNVEYGRVSFALLSIAEYAGMVFLSILSRLMLFNGQEPMLIAITILLLHIFIWVRASVPRSRYDKLIRLC